MKKSTMSSMPIVGGTQAGHAHLTPSNHASKGIVAAMPLSTDMPKIMSKQLNAKKPAMKAMQGKGK